MFVEKLLARNPQLIHATLDLYAKNEIMPDTYVVDMDMLLQNAKAILEEAKKNNMHMYFMLKQLGRNPFIAKELIRLGYDGAVVVDFKEAEVMMKHQVPICNVGHLVQPPKTMIQKLVDYGCEYFTIYTIDKAREINACAKAANKIQKILIRVIGKDDLIYSGQTAGFMLDDLDEVIKEIKQFKNLSIKGVTSFPCFLYDESKGENRPTENLLTVLKAKDILVEHDFEIDNLNTPSTTCVSTIKAMANIGSTSGEPGHGLTGTTPLHAYKDEVEIPSVLYLSEISHNLDGHSYCFGGGHYRRSHMKNALITKDLIQCEVNPPTLDSIDYHFELNQMFNVGDPVIMAFRFQIFVTRSDVVLVSDIHTNEPKIVGRYNSLGDIR
ncbi:MAG: YhfX family PLP-dependent enzyme [Anaerorhabdus sp.]|uniref:YhfX family PLP-dependent enzyme n=1 Tax=Anaerorhabdus sp. TaxID=1872524 RepID=UPI003A86E7B8